MFKTGFSVRKNLITYKVSGESAEPLVAISGVPNWTIVRDLCFLLNFQTIDASVLGRKNKSLSVSIAK